MWPGLKAHWRNRHNSPATGYDQGHIIGGGSSVMGMVALRGIPEDYDEWERLGARGWGWRDVLPYFRKLENDLDFGGELHGRDGPTPVRRTPYEQWTPLAQAARQFAELRQMPFVADMNGDFRDGYCALPMSNTREEPGVGGDLLSRCRGAAARQPDHRAGRAGDAPSVRGPARYRRQGDSRRRRAANSARREIMLCGGAHPVARAADALRDRPRGRLARDRHRGDGGPARRRAKSAEPPRAVHRRASAAARAPGRDACARCSSRASASRPGCPIVRRPIWSSICRASRRGMRSARRSPISGRCCGSRSRAGR